MKNKVFVASLAVALCAAFVAYGDGPVTANWLPTAAGTYTLTDGANWDTGVAPTNGIDIANFAPGAIDGAQIIAFPGIANYNTWNMSTVTGSSNQTIRTPTRNYNGTTIRYMHLDNPNGFRGTWAMGDVHTQIVLSPTDGFVPSLATLDCSNSPLLVPRAGTSVVERLVGGGLLHKSGTSPTSATSVSFTRVKAVDPLTQAKTRIRMGFNYSTISLDYDGPPTNLPVTAGIYVRFDASRPDTIDTVEENGRWYVTAWRDAEGGSVTATPYTGTANSGGLHGQRPWLSEITSANGVPFVDFGAYENVSAAGECPDYATLRETIGPSASLVFPQTTQAREVFVVWQDTQDDSNKYPFVLGSTGAYHLHRNKGQYLLMSSNGGAERHLNDETYIDGIRRSYTFGPYDYSKVTVVSFNLSQGSTIGTLAQDRGLRFGGVRIAEVIIYTCELTSEERQAIHAYLQRKWSWGDKAGPFMLRDIQVDSRDQPVEVTDGHTIDVGLLNVASNQTFIKEGGGTLNVDALARDGLNLNVRGGAVTFNRKIQDLDDTAPAGDPALWLDATASDSFVYTNLANGVAGRTYIHRWNDRRPAQTGIYAIPLNDAIDTNRPFIADHAFGELPAVDFGHGCIYHSNVTWSGDAEGASRLKLNSNVSAYEGYVALRMNNPDSYYECLENGRSSRGRPTYFGTTSQAFTRWASAKMLAGYADIETLGAYWTIDGISYVPYYDTFDFGTSDFHVLSFSHLKATTINRLADDRSLVFGGQQIAEMILYTRPLSERERLQTVAYLMKRWKGMASPEKRESVSLGTVTFADGVDPVFSSDRALSVATLTAVADATITQSGSGTVTLPPELPEATRDYVADGGTLTVDMSDPLADAFYHFDATDAESVVDDGAGGVTQWLDTRRNGMAAENTTAGMSVAKPTLKTVTTRNGKEMPVLDFGDVSVSSGTSNSDSAGMYIKRNGAQLNQTTDAVKELHVVYCDAHDSCNGYGHRFIFSDWNTYPFHRGDSNGQIFGAYGGDPTYGPFVHNGYIAIDGKPESYTYKMTDRQFHVISAAPTNGVPTRSIALDRGARAGGSYQGELIAFKEHLSPARRAYVQKYLAWKWFGEGTEPVYTNSAASLRVANGGTLAITGAPAISVPSVGGSGTINVGQIVDVSSLAFDFPDETSYDHLTATGTLALAASGTVSVTVGAGATAAGDYPLLTATALEGDLDGWTKTIDNQSNMSASLVLRDNALYLRLLPRGTVIILR